MGWFGTFCDEDLGSIKRAIEEGLDRTHENGTKQKMIYHSFKFGASYLAIEHVPVSGDRMVFALVCMWRYSKADGQVMIKNIEESCGPGLYKAPMKLLKMLTPTESIYAHNWRVSCWKNYKKIPEEYLEYKERE